MSRKTIVTAIAAISLTLAGHASAQYSYSEDFTSTVPGPGEGAWNATYVNAGTYSSGDTNPADWTEYNAAVTAPTTAPADPNGNYANFYARYADSGIRSTFFFKNLGGYSGSDVYSANNGEHTVTACYYVSEVADGGADLAGGVTAGIGLRFSGAGYASWPGDANTFQHSVAVPTNTTRGAWQRLSMTFTLTDAARVDLGFFVTNPALTAPYINTGILWDADDDESSNTEYDTFDKEDLVFVGQAGNDLPGTYGTYDYETEIPARLREYADYASGNLYVYFELI